MHRVNTYIPEIDYQRIKALAKQRGTSSPLGLSCFAVRFMSILSVKKSVRASKTPNANW
jgi:hypothetical protein